VPRSSKWTVSFRLPHQNPVSIYLHSHTCHMLRPFYPPWINNTNDIRWVVQIMRQFSPALCYFFWVMPKYLSQTPILEYIQPVTHVTPTNTLCYNLCVPSFTWLLHILALLSHHLCLTFQCFRCSFNVHSQLLCQDLWGCVARKLNTLARWLG